MFFDSQSPLSNEQVHMCNDLMSDFFEIDLKFRFVVVSKEVDELSLNTAVEPEVKLNDWFEVGSTRNLHKITWRASPKRARSLSFAVICSFNNTFMASGNQFNGLVRFVFVSHSTLIGMMLIGAKWTRWIRFWNINGRFCKFSKLLVVWKTAVSSLFFVFLLKWIVIRLWNFWFWLWGYFINFHFPLEEFQK